MGTLATPSRGGSQVKVGSKCQPSSVLSSHISSLHLHRGDEAATSYPTYYYDDTFQPARPLVSRSVNRMLVNDHPKMSTCTFIHNASIYEDLILSSAPVVFFHY